MENVLEELDAPGEWYFDKDAMMLYYYHNGTGPPPKYESPAACSGRALGIRENVGDSHGCLQPKEKLQHSSTDLPLASVKLGAITRGRALLCHALDAGGSY